MPSDESVHSSNNATAEKAELARIADRISALYEQAASNGHIPYLLSQLGNDLGEDLIALKSHRYGLVNFIDERLRGRFETRVVLGKNIYAIFRSGEAAPDSVERLSSPERKRRYHYRFWAAFSVPIPDGQLRHLNLSQYSFEDLPQGEDAPIIPLRLVTNMSRRSTFRNGIKLFRRI